MPLGVLSATRQYSKLDFVLTGTTFLGISMPSFLLGIGGLCLIGLQLKLVPIAGMTTPGKPFDVVDLIRHLALPASILGFGYAALFMRYTRASMLDVDQLRVHHDGSLEGPVARKVIGRHGFRNALIPIITIIGLSIPEIGRRGRGDRAGVHVARRWAVDGRRHQSARLLPDHGHHDRAARSSS